MKPRLLFEALTPEQRKQMAEKKLTERGLLGSGDGLRGRRWMLPSRLVVDPGFEAWGLTVHISFLANFSG